MSRQILVAGALLLWLSSNPSLCAQTTVFLDFSSGVGAPGSGTTPGFPTNLSTLAASAGVDPFSPAEMDLIESGIKSELESIYSGFAITFTTTPPGVGGYDTVDFTQDWASSPISLGASTPKGIAPFDWYNYFGHNEALVFPHDFADIVDEYSGSLMRSAQVTQLTTALAGTAAHELGHTFGLRHLDSYGDPMIDPPPGFPSYSMTGGVQNTHIMATGETGLTEMERESTRSFSRYSLAKLEIAGSGPSPVSLTGSPIMFTPEIGAPHAMLIDAQDITPGFTSLPISGMDVAKVHGATIGPMKPTGTMADYYKFTLPTDGTLWAEVFSLKWYSPPETLETTLTLYDEMGGIIAGPVEYVHFSPTTLYDPGAMDAVLDSEDPAIFNYPLLAGTYYLKVALDPTFELIFPPASPFDGTYDLFVAVLPVPEPASGLLALTAGAGLLLFLRRSRRR